jgi:hypothetical protein
MSTAQLAPQVAPHESPASAEHHVRTQVRCFVYAVSDKCYRAECIDLDIAAEGTTERQAKRGLRDAMVGYLSVVCEGEAESLRQADEKALRKIILRPAPVSHRIHYYVGKMRQAVFVKRDSHARDRRFYTLPAPCAV